MSAKTHVAAAGIGGATAPQIGQLIIYFFTLAHVATPPSLDVATTMAGILMVGFALVASKFFGDSEESDDGATVVTDAAAVRAPPGAAVQVNALTPARVNPLAGLRDLAAPAPHPSPILGPDEQPVHAEPTPQSAPPTTITVTPPEPTTTKENQP